MIDRLYVKHGLKSERPLDPNYKARDAIAGQQLLNASSHKLCVILPGWHNSSKSFPFKQLANRLARKGWAVLIYDFHDQLLEPDEDMVVKSFNYIQTKVVKDINDLVTHHKYDYVHLIGISLGTVTWSLVADSLKNFNSATVVLGGDDLAIDMWHGLRTQHYRQALQKLHVSIKKLDSEWKTIAPVNHLKHFKGKKVKVVMSLHDEVIRTKYQKILSSRLKENGALVDVHKSPFGHTLTVVLFCLFDSPL